jgi:hypothetical protein
VRVRQGEGVTDLRKWVFFFGDDRPEADSRDEEELGGKGAGLVVLSRAGLRVPPGSIISTQCCRHVLANGGAWSAGLEEQVREALGRLERVTGRTYGRGPRPLLVSVRSGAAVVSGEVTPDRFRVRRDDLSVAGTRIPAPTVFAGDRDGRWLFPQERAKSSTCQSHFGDGTLGDAPSLSADRVAELCALGLKVEALFGAPMDIEWGWAEEGFALLQCRPIGGLEVARDAQAARSEEIARLRALAGGRRRLWVAHNLGETLATPTPLTWDIVREFMSGSGGFGLMYHDLGYRPSAEVGEHGFLELVAGRIYADPERLAQLFWGGMPLAYDLRAVRADRSSLDRAPTACSCFASPVWCWRCCARRPASVGSWVERKRCSKRVCLHTLNMCVPSAPRTSPLFRRRRCWTSFRSAGGVSWTTSAGNRSSRGTSGASPSGG